MKIPRFFLILVFALAARVVCGSSSTSEGVKEAGDPDMGTAITVIFDNSGSMEGRKIDEAKAAFQAWLQSTLNTYTWSLIDFDDGGRVVVPFCRSPEQVAQAIAGFSAHTNTPIVSALKLATRQIQERRKKVTPYERHLVLLFTDGQENQDSGGDDEVLNVIRKMRSLNIEVVGIGYHGDGDYLAQASTHYYQADDLEALKSGLKKVDAEVDLGGEVKTTPEDLRAISEMPVESKKADESTPAPTVVPAPEAGHGDAASRLWRLVITLGEVVGVLLLLLVALAFRSARR